MAVARGDIFDCGDPLEANKFVLTLRSSGAAYGGPLTLFVGLHEMSKERLARVFELSYECLRQKINGGRIHVENEASLQLQFAGIIKAVGELLEVHRNEFFFIELEKPVELVESLFGKSGTTRAKIDIYCGYTNIDTKESQSIAIEMKFFKKKNHREPNNRYDVYADIHNLENYGKFANCCYMVVATDHDHYVSQRSYSPDTGDFDFREGVQYAAGTLATYRTPVPYGGPISLRGSYQFSWDTAAGGLHFLRLPVDPTK